MGKFDSDNFVFQYIGIPIYLLCIFGFKISRGSHRVQKTDADLVTGVPQETVAEELARFTSIKLEEKEKDKGNAFLWKKLYSKFVFWLF